MSHLLYTQFKNKLNISIKTSFFLVLLFTLFSKTNTNAQCIGPYARFESISTPGANPPTGFTSSFVTPTLPSPVFTNSGSTPRSGVNFMLSTRQNTWLKTPNISYAKTFSFYVKTTATATGAFSFLVEYSTDGFVTPININTVPGAIIPVVNTTYQLVSVTLPSNTYPNVQFRITDTTVRTPTAGGSTGNLVFDDFSWDTYKSDGTLSSGYPENTVIAAVQTGNGTSIANCSGGIINVDSNAIYNFYDNGGTDQYNLSQTNQVTFKPTGAGYAAGDRVRIQFVSYTGAATDKIEVWDDNGTALNAANNLLTNTFPNTISVGTTYISTISADGSITIKFTSDAAANAAGFNIKVDCVRCPAPIGLATTVVGASNATLTWNTTTASNYDVYYSTSNTPPTGAVTPQGLNLTTNSYTITGLTAGLTYYVWVRSKCSTSPDSYSPWSPSISLSTTSCTFVLSSSPSNTVQSLCKNATNATVLNASASGGTVSTYQWYSNATATTIGGTAVGTNSSSYAPITTNLGTLYYFCVITSTLGCSVTSTISGPVIVSAPSAVPSATAATLPTTSSFSANWNAIAGVTAFFLDVSTNSAFTSFLTGYNNLAVGNVLTYSITGLSAGTTYYYRVSTNNNSCGSSYSSTISQTTVSVTYCIPNTPTSVTSFVNSFSTNAGITNITNNLTLFTAGGYANYTTQSCSQFPSSLVNYSITSVRTDSTDQTFFYYIWIDWNQDGDFADVGETILATTSYLPGPFTGAFAIPNGQTPGNYRMRVSTSWVGPNTPCTLTNLAEMEDYTLVVVPVPPCAPSTPSALTTASVTGTSAIITWTDSALTPNSVYNYYYSTSTTPPTPSTTPSGTVTGSNSVTLSGLLVNTIYYFWVRSNCGTPNPWIGPGNFITIPQDVVNMANGNFTSCNVRFYDSAGPLNNYNDNETYTYTFYPSTSTSKLKVFFESFITENRWDGLSIYDGNSTAAPLISSGLPVGFNATTCPAGSFYGTNSPGTIISTANDGSLTFKFTSDPSVIRAGWDAIITCVTVPKIISFTPTSACVGATPTVTITGSNFTNATSVKFNGVDAGPFTVNSSTSITVTLPAIATTGFITVSNAQATGTSSTLFTVNPIPSIPNAGISSTICLGTSITIGGSALGFPTTVLSQDFNTGTWPSTWTRTLNGGRSPGDFRTTFEAASAGNTWVGAGHTGYSSYFYSFLIGSGVSGDMISPLMDLTSYTASTLTFWIYNSTGTDNLMVYANNNGGAYSQLGSTYTNYGSWTLITINLNSFVGTGFNGVRIKFTGTSDGIGSSDIGVDDIVITGYTNPILSWSPSTGLSATNILNPDASPTVQTSYTLTSTFGNGCSSSSPPVTISVDPRPTISFSASSALTTLCYSDNAQTFQLPYSAVSSSINSAVPNYDIIAYSTTSNDASLGFVPVDGDPLTPSTISISIPASTPGGTYTGSLIITNINGCESVPFNFIIIIKPKLSITTAPSVESICGSSSQIIRPLIYTATTGNPDTYSITWNTTPVNIFTPVTNVPLVSSPIYITVPGGTMGGVYTGIITVQNNGCESSGTPFTVTINQQPTVNLDAAATSLCISSTAQTTTISYSNPIGSPDKYKINWNQPALDSGFINVPLTSPLTNPIVFNVPAGVASGIYTGNVTLTNTGCYGSSMPFTVSIGKFWNGVTSSDWSTDSNWTPIGIPTIGDCVAISSGTPNSPIINANAFSNNLTINTGATLIVNSGFTLKVIDVVKNYGTLTFMDGSSLLQPNDISNGLGDYNGGNIGNITYNRITKPINRYDYNYWSTPVSPQTLFNLSPLTLDDKYFYYDTTIDNWANINSNDSMTPGKGYIIRGPQTYSLTLRETFTGSFIGVPNNGTISTPIASSRYNLIGNPYPSAMNADLFLSNSSNSITVEGTIYLWTHNTPVTNLQYNSNDYAVYNYLGGTGTISAPSNGFNQSTPNGKIASGSSFFIKGINTGGTATFLNSMRVSNDNDQFFKNNSNTNLEEKNRIWIGVNNTQGGYKQLLLGYSPAATLGLDRGYDGELFAKTPVCLYTLSGNTRLSIQGRPMPFQVSDKVSVGFHTDNSGTFTISLDDFDGFFTDQDIYLEDKLLNINQNLKTSNYSFVSDSGTFEDRFILKYTNSALTTNSNMLSEESVIVYKNNQNIMISANNTIIKSIEIFDIRGRELFQQKDISSSQFEVTNFISSQQVVLVKVTSEDGKIVTKKIVY
ncbi:GEVED domain-containing protein [Flavobacterium sp.]|uniref:GEVED domain-containing protein n=1 Tax=Flavobacterium sp. TaxID=239 RepID=UPI003BD6C311